jgi:hypothetical protein
MEAYTDNYPYQTSSLGLYSLCLDGKEVFRGSESDVWKYLHRRHSFSVSEALTNQGYSIEPIENSND